MAEHDTNLDEIIAETIENLFKENDGTFDLSTDDGVTASAEYIVNYLMVTVQPHVDFSVALDVKEIKELIKQRL